MIMVTASNVHRKKYISPPKNVLPSPDQISYYLLHVLFYKWIISWQTLPRIFKIFLNPTLSEDLLITFFFFWETFNIHPRCEGKASSYNNKRNAVWCHVKRGKLWDHDDQEDDLILGWLVQKKNHGTTASTVDKCVYICPCKHLRRRVKGHGILIVNPFSFLFTKRRRRLSRGEKVISLNGMAVNNHGAICRFYACKKGEWKACLSIIFIHAWHMYVYAWSVMEPPEDTQERKKYTCIQEYATLCITFSLFTFLLFSPLLSFSSFIPPPKPGKKDRSQLDQVMLLSFLVVVLHEQ